MGTKANAEQLDLRSGNLTCALNELSIGDKDGQLTWTRHEGQLDHWPVGGEIKPDIRLEV